MNSKKRVVAGTIEFIWHPGDGETTTLINLESDVVDAPHTFEIEAELLELDCGALAEGQRIEIDYVPIEHEVVDPDSGKTSERFRPHITGVRIVD